jgi:2,4-dienoyl-CoA reductase-like NADH-dependent reductase (Old Yellow Enzyme family)/NADPH-dependent 2,4-dienoyl-CoA reductase/sulfur reductase-like enzyme
MVASPAMAGLIMPDGAFPKDQYQIYQQKAAGGAASVCIGETEVNFTYGNKSGFPPATDYTDFTSRQFREWRRHSEMIHSHGALALVQLCQSGNLRQNSLGCQGPGYGPDEMVAFDGTVIHAMTEEIMEDSIQSWCQAAVYMKQAGFDGVNLHFGHSWLPHQFLSPRSNHRTDDYGGSAENRRRFPLRILKAVRQAVGEDFILEMRISGSERCEGGISLEEMGDFCRLAQEYVNIVHVSAGVYRDPTTDQMDGPVGPMATGMYPSMYRPNLSNLEEASYLKRRLSIPVCIVGGIRDPKDAEQIIADGLVDLVAMGRQLNKADPNFPNKVTAGQAEDIDQCIRCGICMGGSNPVLRKWDLNRMGLQEPPKPPAPPKEGEWVFAGPFTPAIPADANFHKIFAQSPPMGMGPDYCSVNPYHDRKDLMPDGSLPRTQVRKKILVIGGGMAGMQAAITAADIGFDVVLCEKDGELGGVFRFSDHDSHKYDLKKLKDRLIRRIHRRGWIDLRLNTAANGDTIREIAPDFVICAVGSHQKKPPIPGLNEYATPLLEAYGDEMNGQKVVLLGGGLAGCEAALDFACRGAAQVDVVEAQETLAPGGTDAHKMDLFRLYQNYPIVPRPATKVVRVEEHQVVVESAEGEFALPADRVIYALGMASNSMEELRRAAGTIPFQPAGDCIEPTKVYHALYDGATAALNAYWLFNGEERDEFEC